MPAGSTIDLEDLSLLAEHFRTEFNRQCGLSIDRLGPATVQVLAAALWPGNVRQLQKVLKQAMIFRGAGELHVDDLRLTRQSAGLGWIRTARVPGGASAAARLPLGSRREAALRIVGDRGAVTRRDLARECGISGEVARRELLALARVGFLRRVGRGRSTVYMLR